MSTQEPTNVKNLDNYGNDPLPWQRVIDELEAKTLESTVLGTTRPDGRPHAASFGGMWIDGAWYLVSGPGTRKSRNLAANPACTVTARLKGIDVVFEGEAQRVTNPEELERVAATYRENGWPAEVEGDAFTAPYSAPSAGPPPWYLYRVVCRQAFGVATAKPDGATRWRFDPE
jgi:nitroimidazol reductase NimA-like FMN-containing flavoprotein (pyridoxamine 5'-phosphate oxidase superfamily)